MHDIFSRHRPLALLAGVVFAQILLMAFQIKRANDMRLVRYWAAEIMTPIERGGTWTFSKVRGVWTGYVDLHNARVENRQLRDEIGQLRLQNRDLESEAGEAKRLAVLLNFREAHPEVSMVAAQVIGASADPTSHTLFINRGTRDHLHINLAVITSNGIVGKLVEVFPTASQVLLINDKESGVGALFADSRTHGVVKGNADPDPRMDYIVNDEKVRPGETILTSGDDRIFPKGLLVGTVIDATPGSPFQVIRVQPAARLDRLEDVIVLLSQQELQPTKAGESFAVVPAPASDSNVQASGTPAATPSQAHAPAPTGNAPSVHAKPTAGAPAASGTRVQAPTPQPSAPRD
ncbi:MAG TPA: rod shape-determining protein MreC [Candidatus Acidoferrales bacterium]|nr:rod shape-determining protein MreC [Candidatus Acidoferrales bacterium]